MLKAYFVSILLILWIVAAQAASIVPAVSEPYAQKSPSIASNTIAIETENNLSLQVPSDDLSNIVQKTIYADAFSRDKPPTISTFSNHAAIRDNQHSKPTYWLQVEFNPPDPFWKTVTDFRFPKTEFPWYLQPYQKSIARLSGWKDGNTLYSSRRLLS